MEPKQRPFSTRLDPALKRRFESIAEIRRSAPRRTSGPQQLAGGLQSRHLRLVPRQDTRPYPDAA